MDGSTPQVPTAPWLTLMEGAQRAKVSVATLRREISRGRLRHARVGGRRDIRLRPQWIDEWLDSTQQPIEPVARPATSAATATGPWR